LPIQNFSLGHDVTVTIYDNNTNSLVSFPAQTGWQANPIYKNLKSSPLNSFPIYAEVPDGWRGSFDFDRTNNTIDVYFANFEAAYWAGGNPLDGSITETIQEDDGTVTQFVYVGVSMRLANSGQWRSGEKVSQRIDWSCSTRQRIL